MNHHVYLFCSNSMNHRCSKKPCFLGFSSVPCCFFKGQTVLSHGCRYATAVSPCEVSPCGKRNPRRKRKDRWRTSWRRRRCRRLAEVQRFFFATSQLQKLDLKIFKIFNQSRNIVTLEIYSIYIYIISYHFLLRGFSHPLCDFPITTAAAFGCRLGTTSISAARSALRSRPSTWSPGTGLAAGAGSWGGFMGEMHLVWLIYG